jgi:hypothetical protein
MGDVGVSQDMVMRTNHCGFAFARGAVDRHTLAEGVAVTDLSARGPPFPFQILGLQADAGEGENLVVFAQAGVAIDNDV